MYTIIVKEKETGKVVWRESYDNQIDTFKQFVHMQNVHFNPEFFEFEFSKQ